ncbi:hypothetical protein [Nocardia pseudobrasiliensis]|uniref:Arsenate reductase n=1 Tax=Nocardia pseudobrasiliensis TaxID=45979 RepID=A0A370HYX6_9NOCA|nr:hypothetical protein [Nocardia pseudobrasiliensis]RDI63669.1 hypothetical protein DFR76_1093 [Nocardia pseudobrasiliensis]
MTINVGSTDWAPDSCTLPTIAQPIRVAEFDQLFRSSARAVHRPGPVRLEVLMDPATEALARELAGRESSCCSFFVFEFSSTAEGLVMSVGVPPVRTEVLDAFTDRVHAAIEARP